jgi:hypothetical protein
VGSKKEKRLARQAAKHIEFEKKKVRQAREPDVQKDVVEDAAAAIAAASATKSLPPLNDVIPRRLMEWSRENADVIGNWSWGPRSCLDGDWDALLHPFLIEYAKKTWNQIYAEKTVVKGRQVQKHIGYAISSICNEAQKRLVELEMDDVDKVFRFRISGKKRFYGILRLHVFMVLWWDPEHNIYPTSLN